MALLQKHLLLSAGYLFHLPFAILTRKLDDSLSPGQP
jgi:hypothetical protein